jgi:probable F420-dependent oxidoreductase
VKLGAIFPQAEIGNDPAAIRDYAQAAEALGYDHLLVYDHVLGTTPERFEGRFQPPYTHETPFHEPFVLFGYLAAITSRIELTTGILVLPQRQTALVAKQAAAVDVLSGGRLRLGVGIGWNFVEYEALGESFRNRGRRVEEQVAVLRKLWKEPLVDFEGRYHRIQQAGINPRPARGEIPVWMGGMADAAVTRIARIADGWFPQFGPDTRGGERIARFREDVRAAGRRLEDVGIEARISLFSTPEGEWERALAAWRSLDVTHLSFNTMRAGLRRRKTTWTRSRGSCRRRVRRRRSGGVVMAYFLAKTDPETYSIEDLKRDGTTEWDGVRNPSAVRAIKTMKPGDKVLIYHSGGDAAVVGLAEVVSAPRPDKNDDKSWVADFKYLQHATRPVTLREVKESHAFDDWLLVRQGRLSTMAAPAEFWAWLRKQGGF